jgi:hypothetical protein
MIDFTMRRCGHLNWRRWALRAGLFACTLVAALAPVAALAQEEEVKRDARLEGYSVNVSVPNDSTALMWLLLIFLGVVALSVMFKNARRSHLD